MVKTCANVGCGKRHGRNGVRVYSTQSDVKMVDPEGGSVNWDTIIDVYARDLCRTERSCKTMTKVGANASKPDSFTKMNVSICVAIYDDKCVAETMTHILNQLKIPIPQPSEKEKSAFLKINEGETVGLKSWRINELRKNNRWEESVLGKIIYWLCIDSNILLC